MVLLIKVKPNSKQPGLVQLPDGSWIAKVSAPPVDGKANDALIRLVADHFGVSKSRVSIQTGASARLKRVLVEDS